MPRPREPVNLLVEKGRKHLTKAEIEDRLESEVSAPSDKIEAPSYLTPELQAEFNKALDADNQTAGRADVGQIPADCNQPR